ncbi:hypothetical protein OsJ_07468 [Oryza sativa Japonica Group]|uniref:Uncharacterized protein n=1 Tax=Oryza sativa subsp. japonica TaxID=39947 RepID=B9F101_ORYSJ|nr:hypothetical protein OsJ_07468 [Oryza sativa Japonica Group]
MEVGIFLYFRLFHMNSVVKKFHVNYWFYCSTKKVDKVMEEMKPIIILSLLGGVSDDSAASYSTNWTLKQVTGETHTRVIPPQLLPKDQKIIFQKPSQHCYS